MYNIGREKKPEHPELYAGGHRENVQIHKAAMEIRIESGIPAGTLKLHLQQLRHSPTHVELAHEVLINQC